MKNKIIGVIILLFIIVVGVIISQKGVLNNKQTSNSNSVIKLKGYVGGEKIGLLNDSEVQKILKDKYGIVLDYTMAGSIEMVQGDTSKQDFLFPSSQTALQIFKDTKAKDLVKSENMFNSPIVFYSWDNVTEALIKQGIVQKSSGSYYIMDLPKFVNLISQGKKWSDIGLSDLYGKVSAISTDPTKSNSGNMFAGLVANMLNNGDVVDDTSVNKIMPSLKSIFSSLGYMPPSSGDLFDQYMKTGEGQNPIIVGYENQLIEFAQANPEVWKSVKDKVRILYPVPTVWSNHPLLALNNNSTKLITALEDKDIQKIAWQKHGFRTGFSGTKNDVKSLNIVGLAQNINKVTQMPKPSVMEKIINALK